MYPGKQADQDVQIGVQNKLANKETNKKIPILRTRLNCSGSISSKCV